jgi:hypothetical protein
MRSCIAIPIKLRNKREAVSGAGSGNNPFLIYIKQYLKITL